MVLSDDEDSVAIVRIGWGQAPERLEGSEVSTSAKGKGLNMPHRYQG